MRNPYLPSIPLCLLLAAICCPPSWSAGDAVQLPKPALAGKVSVETAIAKKKSVRNFSKAPLTLAEVSQILWSANGNLPLDAVTSATSKVIPSAGGLYPLEVFLVCGKDTVTGLEEGVYSYVPSNETLQKIVGGDNRAVVAAACLSQMWMAQSPVMVVVGAMFGRTTVKYGNRGVQYVFMEAGNSNQNIYLQAESLGLKVATVGAFQDAQVSQAAKLPAGVTPLLVMSIGK